MFVVLLLIVFIGFAPTFYLRAFFDVTPIRPLLYVHGALFSGWFVVLIGQDAQTTSASAAQRDRCSRAAVLRPSSSAEPVSIFLSVASIFSPPTSRVGVRACEDHSIGAVEYSFRIFHTLTND
jgi:hypothetical protein